MLAPARLTGNELKQPKQPSRSALEEKRKIMCDSLLQFLYTWLSLTGSEATVRELEMNQTPLLKPVWGIWQISQAGVKCWHVLIALLPTLKPIKPQMMFGVLDCLLEGTSPAVTPFHTELGLILGHVILLTSRSLNSSHTACTGGDGDLWEQTFVLDYGQGFLGQFVQ